MSLPQLSVALRPYQTEAFWASVTALNEVRSALTVMPTGTGKTVVFAALAKFYQCVGRVLVVAHRDELLTQAEETIGRVTGLRVGIEAGDRRVDTASMPDVVVASIQTLCRANRRERFSPTAFGLVVVDEAHHVTSATYREVLDYFAGARVLGVTATPDRLDKRGLGAVFDRVAYVYEIRDAISEGWLVPIKQKKVLVEGLAIDKVRTKGKTGDFDEKDLERQMVQEDVLHRIAAPLVETAGARSTIVFTPTVAVAGELTAVLRRYVGEAQVRALDGSSDSQERTGVIRAFQAGDIRFLVNCALFTEGFDAPRTSCVAVARPTKSRALYAQMIGRGTRLHPESEKDHLLVLDFVGNSDRHKLVSTVDILGGSGSDSPEVMERFEALSEANPDASVMDLIDAAAAQIAAERRNKLLCDARYRKVDIDPFDVLSADPRSGRWGGIAPTEKQVAALEANGITTSGLDKGQASALMEKIVERRQFGLCTFKQARQLARFGLNPNVSFPQAKRAMDAISGAGWKAPAWLYDDPAFKIDEPFIDPAGDLAGRR